MKLQIFIKSLTLWSAWVLAAVLLGGCSRTVTWEEEVPLNTGETIWVKRSMPWVYKGGFGNPFAMSMLPTGEQTILFKYGGSEYRFTGRVHVGWIAITPDKNPVLVAIPGSYGWNYQYESTYYCVVPYYVQFFADKTGKNWTWPEKIEPWLYNLPRNVMASIPRLDEKRKDRYSAKDREERDSTYHLQSPYGRQIDPLYDANGDCPKKYDPSMKPDWSKK
ncbi:MAG: hypothetical protein U1E04_10550 [Hylemonella sp.]|nr:hypothetical protein [Hylemonella sp.]